ncbi:MAG: bifunctional DNA primase/polymerase [Proteobacteria bacterium]|nr:bifunctional DNA primase/polymerase [Pseudomonadota bacterium]
MTNTIKSAIELARKTGWKVFPANPTTKKPVFSGLQQKASADPSTIEQLFAQYSNAVIGLPTGPINGITVVDVDTKKGVDGYKTIDRLGLELWTGVVATTPTGGGHYYFRTGLELYPSSVVEQGIGLGVDVRSNGGFVIAPPSVSVFGQYIWKGDLDAAFLHLFPLGHKRKQIITPKPKYTKPAGNRRLPPRDLLAPVMEGQRNAEMTSRCGYMFARGLKPADVLAKMFAINQAAFSPPLPEREIIIIHRSIQKREGV